ncbi:MAG: flagellar biosynthetic protein FliR [Phycisphaerales bacterium]|nr:flagellar biosynthetic protein FliR [Phycisphaerales bacterium]
MPFELFDTYLRLPVLMLVVARIGGLLMFQPLVGGIAVPMRIRALIVIGLAALVVPVVSLPAGAPADPAVIAFALMTELGLGAAMGIALRMVFVGMQIGGQLIAQESGVAFAQIADPSSGVEGDMINIFYGQLASIVFLIIGGHRVLVGGVLDSFREMPLLSPVLDPAAALTLLTDAVGSGCELGLKLAAPVMVTLLMVNVALGFIGRTVPQLNVATVGFSIKGIAAFGLMAVALPTGIDAFTSTLEEVMGWVAELGRG